MPAFFRFSVPKIRQVSLLINHKTGPFYIIPHQAGSFHHKRKVQYLIVKRKIVGRNKINSLPLL